MNQNGNIRLDTVDLLLMQLLYNQDNDPGRRLQPRYSLTELLQAVPSIRSIATIHARLSRLEEAGLVNQPRKKLPRSRTLTEAGSIRLKEEVYGKHTVTDTPIAG